MTNTEPSQDMQMPDLFDDDVVYAKTKSGQREVLFSTNDLNALERQFLLIVNGNTTLRTLLDLLNLGGDVFEAIRRLHYLGLIEVVGVH